MVNPQFISRFSKDVDAVFAAQPTSIQTIDTVTDADANGRYVVWNKTAINDNDAVDFTTVQQSLQAYVKKGYEVVSDQELVAGTLFTPATDDQQKFQVTLRHATKLATTPIDRQTRLIIKG